MNKNCTEFGTNGLNDIVLLKEVLQQSPIGIILFEGNESHYRVLLVNNDAARIMGISGIEELEGYQNFQSWEVIIDKFRFRDISGREIPLSENPIYQVVSGKSDYYEKEVQVFRKDGISYYLNAKVVAVFNEKKEKLGVISIFSDLTEIIESEREIYRMGTNYQNIFNSTTDAIYILDKESLLVIDINKTFIDMFEYGFEEARRTEFSFVMQNLKRNDDLLKQIKTDKSINIESTEVSKNGRAFFALSSIKEVFYNSRPAILVVVHDITDEKKITLALEERENFLKSVVDNIPVMIMVKSIVNDVFISINKAGEKLLGRKKDNIIGKRAHEIFKKVDEERFEKERLAITTGEIVEIQEEKFTSCIGERILFTMIIPIFIDKNKPNYLMYLSQDITERLQFIENLKEAKEKAEKSERLKTEFLAQVSHEIRTPINALLSFAGLLQMDLGDNLSDDLSDIFDHMDNAGRRLIRTVDLIINMSEMQIGSYQPIFKKVDIYSDVIAKIFPEFSYAAKNKNLEMNCIIKEPKIIKELDEYTVTQIFNNLIDNAIKYTEKGSIAVILSKSGTKVIVEIKDTGIGISENFLIDIFEPFTQEEQGYTRKFEGNGLGLALVKKYCELNNAEIEIESEKGVGSTFRIIFN